MGFSGAVALDGGFRAWKQAGYPVEEGPGCASRSDRHAREAVHGLNGTLRWIANHRGGLVPTGANDRSLLIIGGILLLAGSTAMLLSNRTATAARRSGTKHLR
jgi:hypothetical protein